MSRLKKPLTFKNYNNLIAVFTKKPLNFNSRLIDENIILDNYHIIEKEVHYQFAKIASARQTHSSNVQVVTKDNINDDFAETDGLITSLKNVALVINVADCQGIMLYDPVKHVIGNIHSGWRGTVDMIVVNALEIMVTEYDCRPSDIRAYISPSIGKCCFEVEADVVDMFKSKYKNFDKYLIVGGVKNGMQKYYIDTKAINLDNMLNFGLTEENIEVEGICTKCESKIYHSHRAEKDNSGRNISLVAMINK